MTYKHRIAVASALYFDLESDNRIPTEAEVAAITDGLADGFEVGANLDFAVVYINDPLKWDLEDSEVAPRDEEDDDE